MTVCKREITGGRIEMNEVQWWESTKGVSDVVMIPWYVEKCVGYRNQAENIEWLHFAPETFSARINLGKRLIDLAFRCPDLQRARKVILFSVSRSAKASAKLPDLDTSMKLSLHYLAQATFQVGGGKPLAGKTASIAVASLQSKQAESDSHKFVQIGTLEVHKFNCRSGTSLPVG